MEFFTKEEAEALVGERIEIVLGIPPLHRGAIGFVSHTSSHNSTRYEVFIRAVNPNGTRREMKLNKTEYNKHVRILKTPVEPLSPQKRSFFIDPNKP